MCIYLKEAQAYSEENGLLFMETSAKTAMNVNELFLAIGKFSFCFLFCFTQTDRFELFCRAFWFKFVN